MPAIPFDFFEMSDEALAQEDLSAYMTSAAHIGAFDEHEMGALNPFLELCQPFGLESTRQYSFKIGSRLLATIYGRLLEYSMPDNPWHRELKERFAEMLRRPLEKGLGIFAIG